MKTFPGIHILLLTIFSTFMATLASATALNNSLSMFEQKEAETSSSKRLIQLFDSPLSTSVLTSEDINNSGTTSIPELLRLMPELIVRELTNGQYEVYIRGHENTPRSKTLTNMMGQNALVMIDDRVVFDYFLGGMFWETLPIHVADIERIEVVRGAVSAMYGPNALTGVIHIKTKRPADHIRPSADLSFTIGNHGTQIAQIAAQQSLRGHQWRVSAFSEQRNRFQSTYYNYATQQYDSPESFAGTPAVRIFDDRKKARDISSASIYIANHPASLLAYDFSYAYQESEVHKGHLSGRVTPFNLSQNRSDAINLKMNYLDWYLRLSHHQGRQTNPLIKTFDYTFNISQASLEYEYRIPKWVLRPGIRLDNINADGHFMSGDQSLRNKTLLFLTEYAPTMRTKLIAAASQDKYNAPDKSYTSYQLLATHKLNDTTLIRAGRHKSNRSAFMVDQFLDFDVNLSPSARQEYSSDRNAPLAVFVNHELGLRQQLGLYSWIDFSLFYTQSEKHNAYVQQNSFTSGSQTVIPFHLQVFDTRVTQRGATIDWHYDVEQWKLNIFATWQDTKIDDQYGILIEPISYSDQNDTTTPRFYGGAQINWAIQANWNFNSSLYFMDKYEISLQTPPFIHKTAFTTLINATIRHSFSETTSASISIRNLSNRTQSQYYFTDHIKPGLFLGLKMRLD